MGVKKQITGLIRAGVRHHATRRSGPLAPGTAAGTADPWGGTLPERWAAPTRSPRGRAPPRAGPGTDRCCGTSPDPESSQLSWFPYSLRLRKLGSKTVYVIFRATPGLNNRGECSLPVAVADGDPPSPILPSHGRRGHQVVGR